MTDTSVSQPGALDGALPLAAETAAAVPGAGQGGPTADPPVGAEGDSTAAPAQGEIPVGVPAGQGTTPEAVADPFQETWQTLLAQALELLEVGGPVVAILLGMSVIALAIVLLKLWQFARLRLGARRFADRALEHWQAGRHQEALATLERQSSPLAAVLATAMEGSSRHDVDRETLREEVLRQATAVLESLRGHLRGLEVIASLAPLLGLLGTVLGMIEAFRRLQAAGSQVDPAVLSGGIWEALLTTAVGLAVAIPAVAALNWLERRVERFGHRLEDTVTRVFTVGLRPLPQPAAVPLRRSGGQYAS